MSHNLTNSAHVPTQIYYVYAKLSNLAPFPVRKVFLLCNRNNHLQCCTQIEFNHLNAARIRCINFRYWKVAFSCFQFLKEAPMFLTLLPSKQLQLSSGPFNKKTVCSFYCSVSLVFLCDSVSALHTLCLREGFTYPIFINYLGFRPLSHNTW